MILKGFKYSEQYTRGYSLGPGSILGKTGTYEGHFSHLEFLLVTQGNVDTQHVGHGSNPLAITSRVVFRHVKLKGKHVARTEDNSLQNLASFQRLIVFVYYQSEGGLWRRTLGPTETHVGRFLPKICTIKGIFLLLALVKQRRQLIKTSSLPQPGTDTAPGYRMSELNRYLCLI